MLGLFCGFLLELGEFADRHGRDFRSAGLTALLADVRAHVGADCLDGVEDLLRTMDFDNGIVLSARLGEGGKGVDFRLHEPPGPGRGGAAAAAQVRAGPHDHRSPRGCATNWASTSAA